MFLEFAGGFAHKLPMLAPLPNLHLSKAQQDLGLPNICRAICYRYKYDKWVEFIFPGTPEMVQGCEGWYIHMNPKSCTTSTNSSGVQDKTVRIYNTCECGDLYDEW